MNPQPQYCTLLRHILVRRYLVNPFTGERSGKSAFWATKACGTPILPDEGKRAGLCAGCQMGWSHPQNHPADQTLFSVLLQSTPKDSPP